MRNKLQKEIQYRGIVLGITMLLMVGACLYTDHLFQTKESNALTTPTSPNSAYEDIQTRDCYTILCGLTATRPYAANDVIDMNDLLTNRFSFPEEKIHSLVDENLTFSNLNDSIASFTDLSDTADYVMIYYSGSSKPTVQIHSEGIDIQSPHDYDNNQFLQYTCSRAGAIAMRIHFDRIDVQAIWDNLYVGSSHFMANNTNSYSGSYTDVWSDWFTTDSLEIQLLSDGMDTDWGFHADMVEYKTVEDSELMLFNGDSVSGSELNSMLSEVRARMIGILDTSFSRHVTDSLTVSDLYIMTSTQADEYALDDSSVQNGCFTSQFLHAWDVAPDTNGDGVIALEELYTTVQDATLTISTTLGFPQHTYEKLDSDQPHFVFGVQASILGISFLTDSTGYCVIQVRYRIRGLGSYRTRLVAYSAQNHYPGVQNGYKVLRAGVYTASRYDKIQTANGGIFAGNPLTWGAPDNNFMADLYFSLECEYNGIRRWENMSVRHSLFDDYDPNADEDEDGLSEENERSWGTSFRDSDTDNDGLKDGWEDQFGYDPRLNQGENSADPDEDGANNIIEQDHGTSPFNNDTDHDSMDDLWEILHELNATDPMDNLTDYDGDGLSNFFHIPMLHSGPKS